MSRAAATRPLSPGDYQALARFRRALRVFVRFSEDAARDAGLTPAQHQLLLAIRGHEGPGRPSTSDIAEALQLKLHSAGELASRAEANGLLVRTADPEDNRRTLLDLTAAGAEALEALTLLHRDELHRFRAEMVDVLRELD